MRRMICLRLDAELLAKIAKVSARTGLTRTKLVERGLELVAKQGLEVVPKGRLRK